MIYSFDIAFGCELLWILLAFFLPNYCSVELMVDSVAMFSNECSHFCPVLHPMSFELTQTRNHKKFSWADSHSQKLFSAALTRTQTRSLIWVLVSLSDSTHEWVRGPMAASSGSQFSIHYPCTRDRCQLKTHHPSPPPKGDEYACMVLSCLWVLILIDGPIKISKDVPSQRCWNSRASAVDVWKSIWSTPKMQTM